MSKPRYKPVPGPVLRAFGFRRKPRTGVYTNPTLGLYYSPDYHSVSDFACNFTRETQRLAVTRVLDAVRDQTHGVVATATKSAVSGKAVP